MDEKKGILELGELEYPLFFSPPWHLTISICNLKNLLVPELMKLEYHLLPTLKLKLKPYVKLLPTLKLKPRA